MMTEQECRAALKAHIEAERARDMDAIMDSLCDDVFYLVPGLELRGKAAVRVMYERAWEHLTSDNADEYLRAIDDPAAASWGQEHVLLAYTPDYPIHYGMFVVAHFANGKVRSEHTFYSVTPNSASANPELGPFAGVPGVTVVKPLPGSNFRG